MLPTSRSMHLGVFAIGTGNHIAGWRHPGAWKYGHSLEAFVDIARSAERGKFDMFFIADSVSCSTDGHPGFMSQLEPLSALAAISMVTNKIGLVGTSSTTFNEPYNLARQFASLDHISNGRAGWNIVTSSDPKSEGSFGRQRLAHDQRYERAAEFVETTMALWDSWEPDAIVANEKTGQYVDPKKVHGVDFRGEFLSVRGALNCARCPQGRPVLVQAGSSQAGQAFAARYAEVLFTVQQDLEVAKAFYSDVKKQVAIFGRNPDHCKILPGLLPIVAPTEREAQRKFELLASYIDEKSALQTMSVRLGHDMSRYPLDAPIPELPDSEQIQGYRRMMLTESYTRNATLRDLYNIFAVSRGYLIVCGTPEKVADEIQKWFDSLACDGFNLTPAHFPDSLNDFVELVVPVLQERGLFRKAYSASTLRGHFGLPEPNSRYTVL